MLLYPYFILCYCISILIQNHSIILEKVNHPKIGELNKTTINKRPAPLIIAYLCSVICFLFHTLIGIQSLHEGNIFCSDLLFSIIDSKPFTCKQCYWFQNTAKNGTENWLGSIHIWKSSWDWLFTFDFWVQLVHCLRLFSCLIMPYSHKMAACNFTTDNLKSVL